MNISKRQVLVKESWTLKRQKPYYPLGEPQISKTEGNFEFLKEFKKSLKNQKIWKRKKTFRNAYFQKMCKTIEKNRSKSQK